MTSFYSIETKLGKWFATVCLLATVLTAGAAERNVSIEAPDKVVAGAKFTASILASTDVGQGEHIGFFQVDSSLDGGKTWTAVCYLEDLGTSINRAVHLTAGRAGPAVKLRVRVAFRGGLANDVDYTGAAILWNESWTKWQEPPAKSVTIKVVAQP